MEGLIFINALLLFIIIVYGIFTAVSVKSLFHTHENRIESLENSFDSLAKMPSEIAETTWLVCIAISMTYLAALIFCIIALSAFVNNFYFTVFSILLIAFYIIDTAIIIPPLIAILRDGKEHIAEIKDRKALRIFGIVISFSHICYIIIFVFSGVSLFYYFGMK